MNNIIQNQHIYFNSNTTKPIKFRIKQLKKLQSLIRSNETKMNEAIFIDFGRSAFENYLAETGIILHEISVALDNLKKWAQPQKVTTNLVNLPGKSYIIPEPLGVVLVIGAWNYPYNISLIPAIAAIAAGNTVVLKPSEIPTNTSKMLAHLINSNFNANFFVVVEGGIAETTELLQQKFDKIFFTGSTAVGKIVYKAAAEYLIPVTLELGGKSPAVFDEKCNLKISVKRLIWGKFFNAGQTCIAPDYVLIPKKLKEQFLKLAIEEIKKMDYSVSKSNYVQIINDKNLYRLIELIDTSKIVFGGNYNLENRILEPTILTDITLKDKVMQEEIFGPILPVLTYTDLDEAVNLIKDNPKPLALYIFSNNRKIKDKILSEISSGGCVINDTMVHFANSNLPFGGVGNSGIGSYHGKFGFDTFSHFKSVLEKSTIFEPPIKYAPITDVKLKIIKKLL